MWNHQLYHINTPLTSLGWISGRGCHLRLFKCRFSQTISGNCCNVWNCCCFCCLLERFTRFPFSIYVCVCVCLQNVTKNEWIFFLSFFVSSHEEKSENCPRLEEKRCELTSVFHFLLRTLWNVVLACEFCTTAVTSYTARNWIYMGKINGFWGLQFPQIQLSSPA